MKFRTNIREVKTFHRIIQSVEKLQKRCIIRFTEREMHIICNESEDGLQCWSQINTDALFSDYKVISKADNKITLELSTDALLRVLSSVSEGGNSGGDGGGFGIGGGGGGGGDSEGGVTMRLTNHDGAASLAFDTELSPSGDGKGLGYGTRHGQLRKYIRVNVLSERDFERIKEPQSPLPNIHIELPPLAKLRTVGERMRSFAPTVDLRANNSGELQLMSVSDLVRVQTQWHGLKNPKTTQEEGEGTAGEGNGGPEEPPPDPKEFISVNVSVRAFLKFLSSHVLNSATIASICEDYCVILYVYIGDVNKAEGVLTYYIPGQLGSVD